MTDNLHSPSGKVNVTVIALTSVLSIALAAIAIFIFGGVRGEEFSPQKFAIRSFGYYQIPILQMQVWPVWFGKDGSDLPKYIRSKRLMGDVANKPIRWDIVSMGSSRGDASILTNYLRQQGAVGVESWEDWSKKHTELAGELWPLVARMAHERMYVLIPEMLETARRCESKAELTLKLQQLLAKQLLDHATAESLRGDKARAAELVRLGLEYTPGDQALLAAEKGI